MEDIVTKLNEINNTLSGVLAMLGIFVGISLLSFLILFFWYYDVSKKDEHKRLRKQIEREIKENEQKQ